MKEHTVSAQSFSIGALFLFWRTFPALAHRSFFEPSFFLMRTGFLCASDSTHCLSLLQFLPYTRGWLCFTIATTKPTTKTKTTASAGCADQILPTNVFNIVQV